MSKLDSSKKLNLPLHLILLGNAVMQSLNAVYIISYLDMH